MSGPVGFNKGLSVPKVSAVEGFFKAGFKAPLSHIDAAVCTKEDDFSLAVPHLLIEFTTPQYSSLFARTQCAYDAAFLLYGHNEVMMSLGKYIHDQKVTLFSIATNGHETQIYGHFTTTSAKGEVKYHQKCLIALPSFTNNYEGFNTASSILPMKGPKTCETSSTPQRLPPRPPQLSL